MPRRRSETRQFKRGDVIRTHPVQGFWGCAVVLRILDLDGIKSPLCLIGITPLVFEHEFEFAELTNVSWSVLEIDREARIGPNDYVSARLETCVGIYERRVRPSTHVIGSVNPSLLLDVSGRVRIGNGADGGWPLCGALGPRFGSDAIGAWRKLHDRERWEAELKESRRSAEEMFERVAERERAAGRARRARKST